jgi:hypothetical protein
VTAAPGYGSRRRAVVEMAAGAGLALAGVAAVAALFVALIVYLDHQSPYY